MRRRIKAFFKIFGPGFITGASDNDPSSIGTYSHAGSIFGFLQMWTALFLLPLMIAVQQMCGRIGLVTGNGLAGVIRQHYSRTLLFVSISLLLVANTINIGADLGAMAAALKIGFGLPFVFGLFGIVILTLILEFFLSYKIYSSYLKYLTFSLFAYVLSVFVLKIDWGRVILFTFIPHIQWSKAYLFDLLAIFGTSISPYLFFWQASEEVEQRVYEGKIKSIGVGKSAASKKDLSKVNKDTVLGMVFSQAIMWFIILTTGATLFPQGIHNLKSSANAAAALAPLAGNFKLIVFAIGILGTGLLTVPVLAGSASYAIAEGLNWKAGLSRKITSAHGFYGIITLATIFGVVINFIGVDPITVLYYTAVVNGIIAPPLLVIILMIANNKKIMAGNTNSLLINILGVVAIVVMSATALILVFTSFKL